MLKLPRDMPFFSFCLLPKREVIIKANKEGERSSSAKLRKMF